MADNLFSVLVVDDEADLAEIMMETLEMEDFKVEMALNGKDALEKYKASQFDCVISDSNMPGMKGMELLEEINKYNSSRDNPAKFLFYLCTGDFELNESVLKEKGVKAIIPKPYDLFGVVDTIKSDLTQLKSSC